MYSKQKTKQKINISLCKVSKFGDSHPPAVTLGIVFLNFFQVVREKVKPRLLFFSGGVYFTIANFEFREFIFWFKRSCQGNR